MTVESGESTALAAAAAEPPTLARGPAVLGAVDCTPAKREKRKGGKAPVLSKELSVTREVAFF